MGRRGVLSSSPETRIVAMMRATCGAVRLKCYRRGKNLVGYTGVYEMGGNRNYLQNIALARSTDGYQVDWLDASTTVLSDS